MHTFIIVPTAFGVGLTSISLGMVRALERSGLEGRLLQTDCTEQCWLQRAGTLLRAGRPHPCQVLKR